MWTSITWTRASIANTSQARAVFSPKNQTPRLASNVLPNVYLRFNIYLEIHSHMQYQKSLHCLRCSIMKKSTNWYTQCRVYLCVCACVPSSFHATSHQSHALPGLQHQSVEWLAQVLDFGRVLITILSCWQSLIKRFLPKSTNSLCTRYRLWSRTSVVRMWACEAAFCDACYVWTASVLEVLSRKAQDWHNQPKAFQGK